ncbi:peptide chain release factor N(5)-glutamine methyltransferase [Thermomonas carbonis]|uniref:Release factor glutamine methyltransferase n=1 Tax=Thermomonas carbonis TaxID=1463158 RepID=A0A7G9SLX8_9GAMM|nr:peptide chain release factor N(5)-glutamine methyltransferase [Thermomonas carbonis]QNN68853.1 peptide chain release factor N(5)-glutamine methyltransferase [Thermomonas carbonis]GHC08292.1 release factor glutamine methyltransferase [Thermomonas carbonis]
MAMDPASITLAALLRQAATTIDRVDAEWLLAHALQKPRSWLFAHADQPVPADVAMRFAGLCARRQAGEPVAYLTGMQGFWTLDLAVSPATLIPRAETELLVELALARIPVDAGARVADLGTGSGAIALAIAKERSRAAVIATDASAAALEVARGNAARNHIANVEFREGDWFAPLAGETFDLIASNPPYIAEGDPHLGEGDLRFEPPTALSSGADGLDALRRIVRDVPSHLVAGGWLLLEHGWDHGAAVRTLLAEAGFVDVEIAQDLEGRDRVSLGRAGC